MVKRLFGVNINMEDYKQCCICGVSISKFGYSRHIVKCDGNGPQRDRKKIANKRIAWNKGLTADTDIRVKENAKKTTDSIRKSVSNGTYKPRIMGNEARRRLSLQQSEENRGGKCKWFNVNGIYVQGKWEYNIALKLNELNIEWQRGFPVEYEINGKLKHYTPDFFLVKENIFLEIKGYWWGNDKEKMECVYVKHPDMKILIIEKAQYEQIMEGELVW